MPNAECASDECALCPHFGFEQRDIASAIGASAISGGATIVTGWLLGKTIRNYVRLREAADAGDDTDETEEETS